MSLEVVIFLSLATFTSAHTCSKLVDINYFLRPIIDYEAVNYRNNFIKAFLLNISHSLVYKLDKY